MTVTLCLWDLLPDEEINDYGDYQPASVFDDRQWDHLNYDLDDDEAEHVERGGWWEDSDESFDEPIDLRMRHEFELHPDLDDTELEDWGSTRAARKLAREKYRFNTRKSWWLSHSSKTWKRGCRIPWQRNRRWIAQWERGVAERLERMLKPITVELQELEWHHVPNWGMCARVVGWHGVGKVSIPRAQRNWRDNRDRPHEHLLLELDALQERAWDERERMRERLDD